MTTKTTLFPQYFSGAPLFFEVLLFAKKTTTKQSKKTLHFNFNFSSHLRKNIFAAQWPSGRVSAQGFGDCGVETLKINSLKGWT